MGRAEHLQKKIQAANESAEIFRVVLRITIALLIFTMVFTLLMFLHYKRAINKTTPVKPAVGKPGGGKEDKGENDYNGNGGEDREGDEEKDNGGEEEEDY
uniref:Wsv136 n=1 Tax=Haemonchus contortus TaxID=6289 RepID=A0A7I4Y243_HAECO